MSINAVAPLAGAWIEITSQFYSNDVDVSLPSRERGLKFYILVLCTAKAASLPSRERGLKYKTKDLCRVCAKVAPLAGAWIEIR